MAVDAYIYQQEQTEEERAAVYADPQNPDVLKSDHPGHLRENAADLADGQTIIQDFLKPFFPRYRTDKMYLVDANTLHSRLGKVWKQLQRRYPITSGVFHGPEGERNRQNWNLRVDRWMEFHRFVAYGQEKQAESGKMILVDLT